AAYQLEDLGDELNLTYASAPKFDVVMHVPSIDIPLYLYLEVSHRGKRTIVQILAEDKRPQHFGQSLLWSGNDTPFDPCVTFPFTALVLVILLKHRKTAGQCSFRAIRT